MLVRCSIRRRRVSASRSSLNHRSAQRAWSSRSGHSWQGCARSSAAQPVDLARRRRPASRLAAASAARRRRGQVVGPGAQRRGQVAAHLRVAAVEVLAAPGPGHRARPASGSRSAPAGAPAARRSRRRAAGSSPRRCPGRPPPRSPANLPAGTSITSPGRSRRSEASTSSRRSARRARRRDFSTSEIRAAERGVLHEVAEVAGRRLGVAGERVVALAQLPGQADHAPCRPGTGRRTAPAARATRSRPNWCTRLTAMLYDGRNDDRSG